MRPIKVNSTGEPQRVAARRAARHVRGYLACQWRRDDELCDDCDHPSRVGGRCVRLADLGLGVGMLSKPRAGRRAAVSFVPDPKTWFARVMSGQGIREAALTAEIASDASFLPGELHGDPGDRLAHGNGSLPRGTYCDTRSQHYRLWPERSRAGHPLLTRRRVGAHAHALLRWNR